ncbi:MAG: M23 family metallopeptidase [Minisyncoccota bacterium]
MVLGFLIVISLPASSIARQGSTLSLAPEIVSAKNSQTMSLLEGHLNIDPRPAGFKTLAIVNDTALVSEGNTGETFIDAGQSGTGQISVYVVRKGDTLSSVAKMFGVSANTIVWANDLKSNTLKNGQELVILPISGVRHVVKSGDTLASIAKKYKTDLAEILSYNDLSANAKLKIGDEVIVPDGEIVVSSGSSSGGSSSVGASYPTFAGYYMRPVVGGKKTQGIHGHNGVDIGRLPVGSPVMASADGTVIISKTSGWNGGYGLYIVVSHPNGTQTLYSHLSRVSVSTGQRVEQGQTIGALGNTGKSTGPHLHFEIRGAKNPF